MDTRIALIPIPLGSEEDDGYMAAGGWRMRREEGTVRPSGNEAPKGSWVLRHHDVYVDDDMFRNDLMERNNLRHASESAHDELAKEMCHALLDMR